MIRRDRRIKRHVCASSYEKIPRHILILNLPTRSNDREFGASALARKLGKNEAAVWQAIRGQTYKYAGGKIHKSRPSKIPEEIRAEIRRTYVEGSREFGIKALSEKFGYSSRIIWIIVHEGDAQ